jgi:hypothetical protein
MMRSREEYCTNLRHYAVFYSRGHQFGGIGMNYQTPTIPTKTHNCICTQHYLSAYAQYLQPAYCLKLHLIASHTDNTLAVPTRLATAVSVFYVLLTVHLGIILVN